MREPCWDWTTLPADTAYPTLPVGPATVELVYAYSQGTRVLKQAVDLTGGGDDTFTVDVFPSLRLNHATLPSGTTDYERTAATETVYLGGLGRAVYAPGLPNAGSDLHVFCNPSSNGVCRAACVRSARVG